MSVHCHNAVAQTGSITLHVLLAQEDIDMVAGD